MKPEYVNSMFNTFSRRVLAPAIILCIATFVSAQANGIPDTSKPIVDLIAPKPYKILTEGKRVTVQSKTEISKIMVWTSSGHRFVEENNVKAPSYTFVVSISEKLFYIMLELKDGKRYTEKVGVQ